MSILGLECPNARHWKTVWWHPIPLCQCLPAAFSHGGMNKQVTLGLFYKGINPTHKCPILVTWWPPCCPFSNTTGNWVSIAPVYVITQMMVFRYKKANTGSSLIFLRIIGSSKIPLKEILLRRRVDYSLHTVQEKRFEWGPTWKTMKLTAWKQVFSDPLLTKCKF